jgi:hypothetical protein
MTARIETPSHALHFILAGNSTVTLRSEKTGNRFTYKVKRAKGEDENRPWFVSLMNGPDNEGSFAYMACIFGEKLVRTAKSKVSEEAPSFRAFRYTFERLMRDGEAPGVEIWHEGRCGRCNRKLTVPESVDIGLGPHCRSK